MSFHVLSFEGPDAYAKAGGIASRITGLSETLAASGHETHLWFVGDPELPGHERQGDLTLHRWCQWISRYHPQGVYAGEHGKASDYGRSLPPYLLEHHILPELERGETAVVLAEEWHTVEAVLHLDWLLRERDLRSRVAILWNANNTFGFERIDWPALRRASVITTVSRYMRQLMMPLDVDALVIPNGVTADVFTPPDREAVQAFQRRLRGRTVLAKMARWDPDKRWLLAIDITSVLKREGVRPLLIARGGAEAHGAEVLARAKQSGLRVVDRTAKEAGVRGLLDSLEDLEEADIVNLRAPVDADGRRVLLRGADAVLANSSHEPFGLVGLETMAVGGIAATGCSGEDYAVPGKNALVLQTSDPDEFVTLFSRLQERPESARAIRRNGKVTAKQYAWSEVIHGSLMPRLELLGIAPRGAA